MPYKNRSPFPSAAFVESQRNFTYFDKSLTTGLSDVTIESPGDFLYIDQASTGYVYVELNQRQSGNLAPILLAAGGSIECDFASVKLYAPAQLNKSVRVVIGNGARIKGGANVNADSMAISVVDGGLTRTLAQNSFIGIASQFAVAAQYSHAQLWNPSGSGKNCFVERICISSPTAQAVQLGYNSTAYATTYATGLNKYLAQSSGVAKLNITTNATPQVAASGPAYYIQSSASFQIELSEPILIPPNTGLCLYTGNVNTNLVANFEWYEK